MNIQRYITTKNILIVIALVGAGLFLFMLGEKRDASQNGEPLVEESQKDAENGSGVPPASSPLSSPSGSTARPAPVQPGNAGRLVVAIKDLAASANEFDSILMTINGIEIHSPKTGWVSLSNEAVTYDLLRLKREGKFELIFDRSFSVGSYDQIRIPLGSVVLIKGGIAYNAKVPSEQFIIPLTLFVKKNETSSITLDVLADSSLHTTEKGSFIFAPVIHLTTQTDIEVVQMSGRKVELLGGTTAFDVTAGVNEDGNTKVGTSIDRGVILDLVGTTIVLMPRDIARDALAVSAADALRIATENGHLSAVTSVHLSERDKKTVWILVDARGSALKTVAIDAMTGSPVSVE